MDQPYLDRNAALCVALESGRYQQGRGKLHRVITDEVTGETSEYCCLGVASVEARLHGLHLPSQMHTVGAYTEEYFDGCGSLPPQSVVDYYGWDRDDPMLIGENGLSYTASSLNDRGDGPTLTQYTFGQIAAAFRRTFGIPVPEAATSGS